MTLILNISPREGDWNLHFSAVQRSIPLFFAFDRVNYKRWFPLSSEDCIALKDKFPTICESFMAGGFVLRHTKRKASGVLMDHALEKAYNKLN